MRLEDIALLSVGIGASFKGGRVTAGIMLPRRAPTQFPAEWNETCDAGGVIDPNDKRLRAWIAGLPPRQELVVRMAMRDRAKNLSRGWEKRIDTLETQLKIDTTAKRVALMGEIRKANRLIDSWIAAGDTD